MDLSFKLQKFEGPLDLLLHLIEKNKVDIYDIPIAAITDQYFAYLDEMRDRDMEVMSEFLVMAATLLDIKSKMLLPPEKDEEGEEIDPRAELVEKLLEYKMYKFMSYALRDKERDAGFVLYHKEDIPPEVKKWKQPVDLDDLLDGVTLSALGKVFADVMKRREERIDPVRSRFGEIEQEEVDAGQVMHKVTQKIIAEKTCTFRSLLTMEEGKMHIVVTFLTILELIKMGRIDVEQEGTFGEIYITAKDPEHWTDEEVDLEDME